jgi:hypothetical protein
VKLYDAKVILEQHAQSWSNYLDKKRKLRVAVKAEPFKSSVYNCRKEKAAGYELLSYSGKITE